MLLAGLEPLEPPRLVTEPVVLLRMLPLCELVWEMEPVVLLRVLPLCEFVWELEPVVLLTTLLLCEFVWELEPVVLLTMLLLCKFVWEMEPVVLLRVLPLWEMKPVDLLVEPLICELVCEPGLLESLDPVAEPLGPLVLLKELPTRVVLEEREPPEAPVELAELLVCEPEPLVCVTEPVMPLIEPPVREFDSIPDEALLLAEADKWMLSVLVPARTYEPPVASEMVVLATVIGVPPGLSV